MSKRFKGMFKIAAQTDQFAEELKRLEEQTKLMTKAMKELDRKQAHKEGFLAWTEGHALLCKVKDCGHQNPYAS